MKAIGILTKLRRIIFGPETSRKEYIKYNGNRDKRCWCIGYSFVSARYSISTAFLFTTAREMGPSA
jgi:hypothetical protein